MDKEKIVCFVILHYNTIEQTNKCIASVLALDKAQYSRIVIVDNASPNQTGQVLKKMYEGFKNIEVLLREHNDGFSVGNNEGCAFAIERWNPDFLVVANNDIEFCQKNFIAKICSEYEQNPFAVLGPDIYSLAREVHQSPISPKIPDIKRVTLTILLNQIMLWIYPIAYPVVKKYFEKMDACVQAVQYKTYQEDVCLMGACMIYSKEYIIDRDKIFAPETKFYYEEYIQTLWCRCNNKKIVYKPDIIVYHMEGKSTKTVGTMEKERIKFRICNTLQSARIYRRFYIYNKGKIG